MAIIRRMLFACLCLSFAFPAFVCAGEDTVTAKQRPVAEKFIAALKAADYKTAYTFFAPDVRNRNPFPVFADIQQKVTRTLGSLTSYTFKSAKNPDAPQEKVSSEPSKTYIYELVYKKNTQKTNIPLELTFGSGDSAGQLLSYRYLKDLMSTGEKKK